MRTTITKQIIKNTYALYLKGVDRGIMSSVLSISPASIRRIVTLIKPPKAAITKHLRAFQDIKR